MNTVWTAVLVTAITLVTFATTFMLGMRYKWPFVLDGVRRMNRRFLNPRQMRTAGEPGAYAGIIHHVGRHSGSEYQTPVGIEPFEDGYVIVLPYGTRADWVKNVIAAGTATITVDGATRTVGQPEIVATSDVLRALRESDQRSERIFAVNQCLRLHAVRQPAARS
jgi:deazaflavin-dependent oxidoreductase (nitroreductase family)